jgi:hypothetical protein
MGKELGTKSGPGGKDEEYPLPLSKGVTLVPVEDPK